MLSQHISMARKQGLVGPIKAIVKKAGTKTQKPSTPNSAGGKVSAGPGGASSSTLSGAKKASAGHGPDKSKYNKMKGSAGGAGSHGGFSNKGMQNAVPTEKIAPKKKGTLFSAAPPVRVLMAELPSNILSKALPVASMATVPVKVIFSTLAVRLVCVTLD